MAIYFQKKNCTTEAEDELEKIKNIEQKIKWNDLIYKIGTKKKCEAYDLKKLKTIISFGREIYDGVITLNDGVEELINLKNEIDKFNAYPKPKYWNKKEEKVLTYENANRLKRN